MSSISRNKILTFGNNVKAYRDGRKKYPREVITVIKGIFKEHKTTSILDVGCGLGLSTKQLIDKNVSVSGCDADERMVQVARRINSNSRIKYYHNKLNKLPFPNQSFDVVTSFSSFHWFNTKKMMREIKRVLKRNGLVIVLNAEDINHVKHSLRRNLMQYFGPNKRYRSSKRDYYPLRTLQNAKMEIISQLHFYTTELYSRRQLSAFAQSMKVWSNISDKNYQSALNQVADYFNKYHRHNYLLRDVKFNVIVAKKT